MPDLGASGNRPESGRRLRRTPDATKLDPRLATRFDYDGVFGTVLNRLCIQAVLGHPLTVYGAGGQTRGLINLVDTVECIRISAEHPADKGEYRVFNQFTEQLSVRQIADTIATEYPGPCAIEAIENPRVEAEDHYYNAVNSNLLSLGLVPTLLSATLIDHLFAVVERYQHRVDPAAILPTVRWRMTSSELART